MTYRLINGDCIEVLRAAKAESVHAIVTDPPYGLEFMGNTWDSPAKMLGMSTGANGGFHNLPPGTHRPDFAKCDGELFAQWCEAWAIEALRVLKPGGHLLAFGGTRMWHHLATGIERAGFEIRDSVMWIYGQGFPKAKAIEGHDGWKTPALKPAVEPIVVARKKLAIPGKRPGSTKKATVRQNMDEHGVGGYNIDAVRIPAASGDYEHPGNDNRTAKREEIFGEYERNGKQIEPHPGGRFPANVMFDPSTAAELDRQSGITTSGAAGVKGSSGFVDGYDGEYEIPYGDMGGASRFFYVAKASTAEREEGLAALQPGRLVTMNGGQGSTEYTPETGLGVERANTHPTVKPKLLMLELIRLICPPGGQVLDMFMGSGTTGVAAIEDGFRFIGIEQDPTYFEIAKRRLEHATNQIQGATA